MKKYRKLDYVLLSLCIVTAVLMLSRYTFMYANMEALYSDPASQIVQMFEMRRLGTLMPASWYDSTEIHLLTYPMYFLSYIFNDGILIRNIAQLIFEIILLILIIFMNKVLFSNNSWVVAVVLIFCNMFPGFFSRLFFAYADYLPTIFGTACALTFLYMILDDEKLSFNHNKYAGIMYGVSVVLTCSIGFQGLAQITIPFSGGVLIYLYIRILDEKSNDLKEYYDETKGVLFILLITFFCSLLGIVINKLFISKLVNVSGLGNATVFASDESFKSVPLLIYEGIYNCFISVSSGTSFFSASGIQAFTRLFCFVLLFVIVPVKWFKEKSNYKIKLIKIIVILNLLIITTMMLFGSAYTYASCIRYFAFPLFFIVCVDADYIYRTYFVSNSITLNVIHTILLGVIILILDANLILPINYKQYYQDTMQEKRGLTDFLKENELNYGFCTFTDANKNTALSNNEVKFVAISVNEHNQIQFTKWLCSSDWYETDFYEGKSFILVYKGDHEEYSELRSSKDNDLIINKTTKILEYENYDIWVFDYNIIVDF